ncbi:hypothetical protein EVAR_73781_1 [Eumeta japonica]|uniref:Uncharacterized protein n=1 Tax=Eumeta variegata TaxID=151549 RepID=A0A4C1ZX05_EUMVA|nr:hypothetical protein EVAR_73781_1 [Eumeta japonica]
MIIFLLSVNHSEKNSLTVDRSNRPILEARSSVVRSSDPGLGLSVVTESRRHGAIRMCWTNGALISVIKTSSCDSGYRSSFGRQGRAICAYANAEPAAPAPLFRTARPSTARI